LHCKLPGQHQAVTAGAVVKRQFMNLDLPTFPCSSVNMRSYSLTTTGVHSTTHALNIALLSAVFATSTLHHMLQQCLSSSAEALLHMLKCLACVCGCCCLLARS
jgi:hypothetical protein